jgi:hypothetical protein
VRSAPMTFLVCGVIVCCLRGSGRMLAEQPESLENLRHAKLKAAQEWWDLVVTEDQQGSQPVKTAEGFRAAEALRNAQLDVAANKQDRTRTLTAYRDRMQSIYDKTDAYLKAGMAGPETLAEARVHLLEAKIAIKQEEEVKQ